VENDVGNPAALVDRRLRPAVAQFCECRGSCTLAFAPKHARLRRGLVIERDAIDVEPPWRHDADVGRVAAHGKQPPHFMELSLFLKGIGIDQEDQGRALPFVNSADRTEQRVAGPPRRDQRGIWQQIWPVIVEQTKGGRIAAEIRKDGSYVSHRSTLSGLRTNLRARTPAVMCRDPNSFVDPHQNDLGAPRRAAFWA
jgi:hypothetical protein